MDFETTDDGAEDLRNTRPARSDGERSRVLLVDDEPSVVRAYTRLLEPTYEVQTASDAEAAVELLDRMSFDVVVTDLRMPGQDGMHVLRAARARDPDVPVILLTASPSLESSVQALEDGALKYLVKPIERRELRDTVEAACQLHSLLTMKRQLLRALGPTSDPVSDRAALDARFTTALASIHMDYQPIVRWSDRSIVGYEALLRTGEASLANPLALLKAAKGLGRGPELSHAVWACVAADIERFGITSNVFVNIDPGDLEDNLLFSTASPLAPVAKRIILEITEREALKNVENVRARVFALRRLGFRIAIDDLGAGYSALTSFAELEPEIVKIDMSLVRSVHREPLKRRIIRLVVGLCSQLGITAVAEGVETLDEFETLRELGCDVMQGFLLARPGNPLPQVAWGNLKSSDAA
ncbi:MAG: EAL domain-containing response regulator [Micrococcales bacterium]|nr:EAL domain-containing response regulator [Micrococcales bacterium]